MGCSHGHVPQNSDAVILGDSLGFMLILSFPHLNAKLLADLPVHVCSSLVVAVDVLRWLDVLCCAKSCHFESSRVTSP